MGGYPWGKSKSPVASDCATPVAVTYHRALTVGTEVPADNFQLFQLTAD